MKALIACVLVAAAILFGFSATPQTSPQDPARVGAEMAAMMEQAARYTQPGEKHQLLERFLGKWSTEMRFFMAGQASPPEKGTAETTWLEEGRWLQTEWSGSLMGQEGWSFSVMGYDNFKMSYVMTNVTNMDTAMNRYEGDLDPKTNALVMYGTIDEYLTGEQDKMAKTVFRFPSDGKMVMEIHDLAIGEANTKVVEVTYTR